MAAYLVQDPSESLYGPDLDGAEFSGYGGGEMDADSGVLTLTFTPHTVEEIGDYLQDYAQTTVRFVEVEKLLTALSRLERFSTDQPTDPEFWRTVLAELLDAHEL
jgi:hypothetical protein